jgi:DNA-binding CsgD family transcriptional regulator
MRHLYFLYFLIIFILGIGTFSVTLVLYQKLQGRVLRAFLAFYTIMTMMVFFNTFTIYIQTNLTNPTPLLMVTFNVLRAASIYLLITAIPAFMHYLCNVSKTAVRNGIFISLTIILFIGFHLFEYLPARETLIRIGPYLEGTIFIGMILYTIVVGFTAYPRLQDAAKKPLAQQYLWVLLIFFSGIFSDMYLSHLVPIRIYPIFYGTLSIVFLRHFLSAEWQHAPQAVENLPVATATGETLAERCAPYNITEREREVIALLLQGYSNPQIAEKLFISLSTVKSHLRNIYPKIGVKSRYELIVHFKDQSGVIPPSPENK